LLDLIAALRTNKAKITEGETSYFVGLMLDNAKAHPDLADLFLTHALRTEDSAKMVACNPLILDSYFDLFYSNKTYTMAFDRLTATGPTDLGSPLLSLALPCSPLPFLAFPLFFLAPLLLASCHYLLRR